MGRNVDAKGPEQALERFKFFHENLMPDNGVLYYSIWGNNKLKWPSRETDTDAAVSEFSEMLRGWEQAGTGGEMEVRFHIQEINDATNNKTPYTGSFVFRLYEPNVRYERLDNGQVNGTPGNILQPGARSTIQQLVDDIEALEKVKALLFPGAAEIGSIPAPVENKTTWDRIEGLLQTPIVEEVIAGLANRFGVPVVPGNNGAIAGEKRPLFMDNEQIQLVAKMSDIDADDVDRLAAALSRLAVNEPDFVGLMEKLADLKEKKPNQYKMAKSFL